jgi:hypothetical protein
LGSRTPRELPIWTTFNSTFAGLFREAGEGITFHAIAVPTSSGTVNATTPSKSACGFPGRNGVRRRMPVPPAPLR